LPSLDELWVTDPLPDGFQFVAPLSSLRLDSTRKLHRAPEFADPTRLSTLVLAHGGEFDLAGLSAFTRLARVELERFSRPTGIDSLLALPLRHLVLQDCPAVEPRESLRHLALSEVL